MAIPLEKLAERDGDMQIALMQIRRCAEVALSQSSLSRRQALREIVAIAKLCTND
jgi:hypothetical protein